MAPFISELNDLTKSFNAHDAVWERQMVIYDVPFDPVDSAMWKVSSARCGERRFASREHALSFAMSETRAAALREPDGAFVNIEGADGKWRLFDPELKSVP